LKKTAVFPGSFDPITLAHVEIVERGLEIFDKVIIAIGVNSVKKGMFSPEQRLEMIRQTFQNHSEERLSVVFFEGLTVNFCRSENAGYILRGMRNVMDFESERAIAQHNKDLAPEIQTVFLVSPGHYSHISSTIIREILANKGDASPFVPKEILKLLDQSEVN